MTESEWLACADPKQMVWWITSAGPSGSAEIDLVRWRQHPSERKLRLFACACCRQTYNHLDPRERHALKKAELYADGQILASDLVVPEHTVARGIDVPLRLDPLASAATWAANEIAVGALPWHVQAALLRDIIGNPWRPVRLPPVPPIVQRLAQVIYDTRDFAALPILADALEDVGCDNDMLLRHCRGQELCPTCLGTLHRYVPTASQSLQQCLTCMGEQPVWPTGWIPLRGPHVRGCWCLDLLLGKC